MNLYLISQEETKGQYDVHDAAIVCAESESDARLIHPNDCGDIPYKKGNTNYTWTNDPLKVKVEEIGKAAPYLKRGVVLASFISG